MLAILSGISHFNSQRGNSHPSSPLAMMIPTCRAAVKPVAMTIKDLGRWESRERVQRYSRSACRASPHIMTVCAPTTQEGGLTKAAQLLKVSIADDDRYAERKAKSR